MIFIGDHSRKVCAIVLKVKDQVLDNFKEFHVKVERETRKQMIEVRQIRVVNIGSI